MRPILIMTCVAVLTGGTTVAAIATGQTTAVDPPVNATPDTTQGDRTDPDPGGDTDVAPSTPSATRPAPTVDTAAVTNQEISVAVEEAAFDTSLSAMAAQLDGHLNGVPQAGDGPSVTTPAANDAPAPPPLAAIITAVICVIGAAAALFLIVRSGLRAPKKQHEDESLRQRALRRLHTPRTPESGSPST